VRVKILAMAILAAVMTLVPVTASASQPGPFVTFLFSRTEQTVARNCVADPGQPTLSGTIAPYMASLGLPGFGTVNTVATKATDYCTHSNETLASSWPELQGLTGWTFGPHEYDSPAKVATLTPAQQQAVTCGQATNLANHNLGPGTGLIAYPALQAGSTAIQDLQANYGQHCFIWGRMNKTPGITTPTDAATAPFWQYTQAMKGGPGMGSKTYTDPQAVINQINALQPGQWLTIQVYALVTGTNPAGDTITWSCGQGTPNTSNDVERYCWSDFQQVLQSAAAAQNAGQLTVTSPSAVGAAFGRPGPT
jgi:hypothetical protein